MHFETAEGVRELNALGGAPKARRLHWRDPPPRSRLVSLSVPGDADTRQSELEAAQTGA